MNTIVFTPLKHNQVTLHQLYRGECKAFIEDMLINNYHNYEFSLDEVDGKALFQEIKRYAKYFREKVHFCSNHGAWYIQVIDKVVLYKRAGQYMVKVNSCRY